MKKKLFVILGVLVLSTSLLLSFIFKKEDNKTNKGISKVEKILSKPEGIQAYTLEGEKTNKEFNDLIKNYVLDKITCKNGTVATYNKATNEVSLSNIHMPDYCTMDFVEKPVITIYDKLLADNPTIQTRSSFSEVFTTTNTETLYKSTESGLVSYTDYATWNNGSCTYEESKEVYYVEDYDMFSDWSFDYATEEQCTSTPVCNLSDEFGMYFIGMNGEQCITFAETLLENGEINGIPSNLLGTSKSVTKDVYYFAGDAKNNWVKFGTYQTTKVDMWNAGDPMYWRIIRTNHDGSVRLLYSGTSPDTENNCDIGNSAFNSLHDDPMYVGYKYGTSGTLASNRTNENDSTIKEYIDNWYSTNLSSYSKYLSHDAVYCNDRQLDSGTTWSTSSYFTYITYRRLNYNPGGKNANPTYDCADSHDAFSRSNPDAKLTYPIGLMTADEIVYAGGAAWTDNTSAWYYLNSAGEIIANYLDWWLMSPIVGGNGAATEHSLMAIVNTSSSKGAAGSGGVSDSLWIRPVISIKANALWSSGDGSPESPYEIVYN